ncbi:MAG: hypothetical protein IPL61_11925 [Myxococcales bacterium]|nr:hypothetical protein [Myxococcales bacterium]
MIRVSSVIVIALAVAACGGSHPAPSSPDEPAPPPDRRTELERRRDAACEALGPRMTDCAIADARATMSPEELAKLEIESTAPVHTKKFVESCQAQSLSSRQVRVYEVPARGAGVRPADRVPRQRPARCRDAVMSPARVR